MKVLYTRVSFLLFFPSNLKIIVLVSTKIRKFQIPLVIQLGSLNKAALIPACHILIQYVLDLASGVSFIIFLFICKYFI